MGTLDFCIREAVVGVGGVEALESGDVLLYNWPYGTGSHPQDVAMVMPVFDKTDTLIGYTAIKGPPARYRRQGRLLVVAMKVVHSRRG